MKDSTIKSVQKVNWDILTLDQAKAEAHALIDSWDFRAKAEQAHRDVDAKTSVKTIAIFMWDAAMKGLKIKRNITISELEY